MSGALDFVGGVYEASLPGGRAVATVEIAADGVHARTEDGKKFAVPFVGMEFEVGGTDGAVVFCRSQDRAVTIYTNDREFLRSLAMGLDIDTEMAEKARRAMGNVRRKRWTSRRVTVTIVMILALLAATIPTVFGYLVESAVERLPTSWDKELGAVAMRQVDATATPLSNPVVDDAMRVMLERLQKHIPPGYDSWEFRVMVVDDDSINAFALPGGQMVFHSGLLARAETADAVAGVMAHEMAHVLERHGMQRIAQALGIVAAAGLVFGDTGVLAGASAEFITTAAINQYSRGDEAEADAISVAVMHSAGLDPNALSAMFERMAKEGEELPDVLHWISTHPTHRDRIEAIADQVKGLGVAEKAPLDIRWETVLQELSR